MLVEAMRVGLPVPPDVLLKASDIPYRDEILASMQQPPVGGLPPGAPPPGKQPLPAGA